MLLGNEWIFQGSIVYTEWDRPPRGKIYTVSFDPYVKFMGALSSNDLHWQELNVGYPDNGPSNSQQGATWHTTIAVKMTLTAIIEVAGMDLFWWLFTVIDYMMCLGNKYENIRVEAIVKKTTEMTGVISIANRFIDLPPLSVIGVVFIAKRFIDWPTLRDFHRIRQIIWIHFYT